jgi:hypothetical protein
LILLVFSSGSDPSDSFYQLFAVHGLSQVLSTAGPHCFQDGIRVRLRRHCENRRFWKSRVHALGYDGGTAAIFIKINQTDTGTGTAEIFQDRILVQVSTVISDA